MTKADKIRAMTDEEMAKERINIQSRQIDGENIPDMYEYVTSQGGQYPTRKQAEEAELKWLQSEDEENLIGKKVYMYMVNERRLCVRLRKITDVYKENDETKVKISSCYTMPLSSIGRTDILTGTWFTFKRDDRQARMLLFGDAHYRFSTEMQEMLQKMELIKSNYQEMFAIITDSEIDENGLENAEEDE